MSIGLRVWAQMERHPSEKETSTPWTAPFVLKEGAGRRRAEDVERIAAFASVDIDESGWTIQRIDEELPGRAFVAHTTTKSIPEHQRWRVIVRLDREHTTAEFGSVWRSMNLMFHGELDSRTKNFKPNSVRTCEVGRR